MPCISMFSRFKADKNGASGGGCGSGGSSSSSSQNILEGNPITTFFEIGRQTATAGPGYLWRVHDAYRKNDGKVNCSSTASVSFFHLTRIPDIAKLPDKGDKHPIAACVSERFGSAQKECSRYIKVLLGQSIARMFLWQASNAIRQLRRDRCGRFGACNKRQQCYRR